MDESKFWGFGAQAAGRMVHRKCNEGDFRRSRSRVGKGQGSALTELNLRYLFDLHRKVLRRQLSFREKDRLEMTDLESSE